MKLATRLLGYCLRRRRHFKGRCAFLSAKEIQQHALQGEDRAEASLSKFFVLFFLTCIFAVAGCSVTEPPADIVIINGAEPESLDPAIITGQGEARIVRGLFEGLMRLNPKDATPIPGLAHKWEVLDDGRTFIFHLRTNAVWSTGEAITTDDVIYSWFRVLDPLTAAEYAGQMYYIKGAEDYNTGKTKDKAQVGIFKLDSHTLRVELTGPTPFFLDLCAFPTLAVVPRAAIEKHGDRWLLEKPLPTSGPYLLEAWRIQDKVRVRKNPRYWDVKSVQNEMVDFLPCTSAMTAMNIYQHRQADVIWDKTLIPSELMDVLKDQPDCHRFDYLGTFFMRFNVTRKPFDDVRVRKALALVIDKKRLTEKITRSGERIANHLVPAGMPIYTSPPGLGYDPELGRKLLAEAGFPGGKNFPTVGYLFRTGKQDEQIAVELQAMFKEQLGINIELRPAEWKVYLAQQGALDYDLSRSSWIGDYNDPNTFLDMFMSNNGNNRTGWKNERYDELMREGNRQTDPKKREKILQQAESLLITEGAPIAPLYFYAGINFFRSEEIEGIHLNLLDEHPVYAIRRIARNKK
jgi:oligopeptide transport system substrate-binding protein